MSAQPFISYQESVHGRATEKGSTKAAVCTDCHGSHKILAAERRPIFDLQVQCARPRAASATRTIEQTFNQSIHGQAIARGNGQSPVLHGLPRNSLDQGACRSEFASLRTESFEGYLRALPRRRAAFAGIWIAREPRFQLHGQLSRPGVRGRFRGCRELLELPRRAQHSAFERSAFDDQQANLDATCGKCHKGATQKFTLTPRASRRWNSSERYRIDCDAMGADYLRGSDSGGDWRHVPAQRRSSGAAKRWRDAECRTR